MAVITISREAGSGGDEIARGVCEALGYRYFDKALMTQVAQEQGIARAEMVDFSEDTYRARNFIDALFLRSETLTRATVVTTTGRGEEARLVQPVDEDMAAAFTTATIRTIGKRGQTLIVGRGGQAILQGKPDVLHVRVVAKGSDRMRRLMQSEGLSREAAIKAIGERDQATAQYLRRFHDVEWSDPMLYHLTVNTSLLGLQGATSLIVAAAKQL